MYLWSTIYYTQADIIAIFKYDNGMLKVFNSMNHNLDLLVSQINETGL